MSTFTVEHLKNFMGQAKANLVSARLDLTNARMAFNQLSPNNYEVDLDFWDTLTMLDREIDDMDEWLAGLVKDIVE